MNKAIYFDMDGTIADLYGVMNWLDCLEKGYTKPYRVAHSMVDMKVLGKELNRLQHNGYVIGIVSWLSKTGTEEYNKRVIKTKQEWLQRHLGAVQWDEIHIVEYGTPKQKVVDFPLGILFDDEKQNRDNWSGTAFDVNNIIEELKKLA